MLSFYARNFARVVPRFSLSAATFAMKYTKTHEWIDLEAGNKVKLEKI